MKGDLTRLYGTLRVEELFRLRILALARGDLAECDRLDRAIPLEQYGAYCARLDASEALALCALVDLLPKLAKLRMLEAVRPLIDYLEGAGRDAAWTGYLAGHEAGWKASGQRGTPPSVSDATLTKAAEKACRVETRFSEVLDAPTVALAGAARTSRDALAAFADDELGVSVRDLLGAWMRPALDTLADHAEALDAAEPDVTELALLTDVMRLAWRRHGLRDATAEVPDELRARFEAIQRRGDTPIDD